jgi:hypothetical protein
VISNNHEAPPSELVALKFQHLGVILFFLISPFLIWFFCGSEFGVYFNFFPILAF